VSQDALNLSPAHSSLFLAGMAAHPDASEKAESRNWFEEWFNHPLYLQVYSHRNDDEAAQCVQTILALTELNQKNPASHSVLDIACGAGRHALEFSRLGYNVTANDLSPFLLDKAKEAAQNQTLPLRLSCCDMRHIPTSGEYHLVVQLFTSFGYFECHKDDQLVLTNAYHALQPDGWYVLDLINPVHLRHTLVAHSRRTAGELTVVEDRAIKNGRITKTIQIIPTRGEPCSFSESVRLYSEREIRAMLHQAGFAIEKITGNYQGELFEEAASPRMMLFCRKA